MLYNITYISVEIQMLYNITYISVEIQISEQESFDNRGMLRFCALSGYLHRWSCKGRVFLGHLFFNATLMTKSEIFERVSQTFGPYVFDRTDTKI